MTKRKADDTDDYFDFVDSGTVIKKKRYWLEDDFRDDDVPEIVVPKKTEKSKKRARLLVDKLPDEIPILTKEDLLLHNSQEKEDGDRHHMTTWIDLCLPPTHYSSEARNKLASAIMSLTYEHWGYNGLGPSFIPLDDQAAIWNAALRRLGYPVSVNNCLVVGPRRGKEK